MWQVTGSTVPGFQSQLRLLVVWLRAGNPASPEQNLPPGLLGGALRAEELMFLSCGVGEDS